ncbi:hypothetical protein ACIQZB_14925 [Streptomyces sp. NPDC097727]|uniref:hypothetical protein n=1 Tax=Streptomyces sp. NPDC097727 TaxID=3366092 RepID=UPI003820FAB2
MRTGTAAELDDADDQVPADVHTEDVLRRVRHGRRTGPGRPQVGHIGTLLVRAVA